MPSRQLLVDSPADLPDQLADLLVHLSLLPVHSESILVLSQGILALQIDPDLLQSLLFVFLRLPELVFEFKEVIVEQVLRLLHRQELLVGHVAFAFSFEAKASRVSHQVAILRWI